ncbi:MAG: cytochrome P450, partial [Pseudomonadales bacterium]|nr:cytochrome P450 [Pseudomonadales bacterium]
PLIGYTLEFMKDPIDMLQKRYQRYGEISWVNVFGIRMVQMIGPDATQFVFMNKGNIFSNNQGWDFFIGKFFHRGIMLLDFEEHRWHRRIMQQAFNKPVLKAYIQRMNPQIERDIQRLRYKKKLNILPTIKQLTLNLATDVFMGGKLGKENDKINDAFIHTVKAGTAVIRKPVPGLRWKKGLDSRKVLEDFFYARIAEKRKSHEDDMFSVLCRAETEDGDRFSDDDIVNHMIFLMMAAHDTSTITLSTMFYHLAKNPEWQEKVREESRALGKKHLDYDDLDKMTTISLVMKEALRMCPPVPSIPRKTVKDCEFKGFKIPKGSMINIFPYFNGYMEAYWKDPEKFDPERFSDDRREDKIHPYAWAPFGGGAHKCIGLHFADLQVKAIMHQIVLNYRWSVDKDYEMPLDTTSLPVPKDGLPVKWEKIK